MGRGKTERDRQIGEIWEERMEKFCREIFLGNRLEEKEVLCGRLWAGCVSCGRGIVASNAAWVRRGGVKEEKKVDGHRDGVVATVCGQCEEVERQTNYEQGGWGRVRLGLELIGGWPWYQAVAKECETGEKQATIGMDGDVIPRKLVLRAYTKGMEVRSIWRVKTESGWRIKVLDYVEAEFLGG